MLLPDLLIGRYPLIQYIELAVFSQLLTRILNCLISDSYHLIQFIDLMYLVILERGFNCVSIFILITFIYQLYLILWLQYGLFPGGAFPL